MIRETGTFDREHGLPDGDRPGVLLATAVERLIAREGVSLPRGRVRCDVRVRYDVRVRCDVVVLAAGRRPADELDRQQAVPAEPHVR